MEGSSEINRDRESAMDIWADLVDRSVRMGGLGFGKVDMEMQGQMIDSWTAIIMYHRIQRGTDKVDD